MTPRTNEASWIESTARWQINVQRDGRRRTFTSSVPGSKGKVAAERRADAWITSGIEQDKRFGLAYGAFLEDIQARLGTDSYNQHEKHGRLYLLPAVKYKRLSVITNQDWQNIINKAYKMGVGGAPLSKKSLENIRGSITAFYRFARKNRYPMERPEDIIIPSDAPVRERRILQPDQLRVLFSCDTIQHYKRPIPCFYIHAWRFQLLTGLRPGEVAGLEREKDLRELILLIQRSINQHNEETRGKNRNARRAMILTRQALAVLEAQRRMLEELNITSKWIFPSDDGSAMRPTESYKHWLTYREQHGIASSLYELRHTMVSLGKADVPEELMKLIVGHSKAMPTYGTYGHEVDGDLLRVASILEKVYDAALGVPINTHENTQLN
jgi:integrase